MERGCIVHPLAVGKDAEGAEVAIDGLINDGCSDTVVVFVEDHALIFSDLITAHVLVQILDKVFHEDGVFKADVDLDVNGELVLVGCDGCERDLGVSAVDESGVLVVNVLDEALKDGEEGVDGGMVGVVCDKGVGNVIDVKVEVAWVI